MPDWFLPLLSFVAVVGFIAYAFRQGAKVRPSKERSHSEWMNINEP